MKQDKRTKDNQPKLIFDYKNFVNKSSQLRYSELRNEVKNKLDNISSDINIAGGNAEEKKYNLLMHYKYLLENFKFSKKKEEYSFQISLAFTVAIVTIVSAWFSIITSNIYNETSDHMTAYGISVLVLMIIAIGIAVFFLTNATSRRRIIEEERQIYIYIVVFTIMNLKST